MCRIIINLLLLMSITTAAPDGRPKRHFSYIKNFILTNFFEDYTRITPTTQTPTLAPEFQYELYKIPGHNDILIKTVKCKPGELTIVDNSGDEKAIKSFESFIGTKSVKETDKAFRNVYKLLATRILNEPKINIFQTIVPINGLHYEARHHKKKPFRVHPNKMQSVIRNEEEVKEFPAQININKHKNNLKRPFETILKNPLKKWLPVNSYQERIDEQINVHNPKLPIFFEYKPYKLFPLSTNSYRIPKGENHMYNIEKHIRLEPENFKYNFDNRLVSPDSLTLPSTHLKKPVHIGVVVKDKHHELTLEDKKSLESIGSTPTPIDFLINDDSATEDNSSKTNNSKPISTDNIINSNIYFPNNEKSPQIHHKYSDKIGIVKENDVVSTQSPFNIKLPPLTTTTNKLNNESITKHKHNVSNVVNINNNLPTSETLSQCIYQNDRCNKTHLDKKLYEKEGRTDALLPINMTALPIVDKKPVNVHNTKSNDTKIQTKENLTVTTNNKTKDAYKHTFSDEKLRDNSNTPKNNYSLYDSQRDNSSKIIFVEASDGDVKNTNENVNAVKSNNSHISIVQRNDSDINVAKTNESHANVEHANDNDKNIFIHPILLETNDTVAEMPNDVNLSQLHNEEIDYDNSSKPFETFELENQVKTNVHTNSPLPQEDSFESVVDTDPQETFGKTSSYKPEYINDIENSFNLDIERNGVKTNAVSNTPVSSTYSDYTQPITNSPPVNYPVDQTGDNNETSTTESATIISTTELFQGSEIGDRITSIAIPVVETNEFENENQIKEWQIFSESFTEGRGDIPSK